MVGFVPHPFALPFSSPNSSSSSSSPSPQPLLTTWTLNYLLSPCSSVITVAGHVFSCAMAMRHSPTIELPSVTERPLAPPSFILKQRRQFETLSTRTLPLIIIIIIIGVEAPVFCVITEIRFRNQFGTDEPWTKTCIFLNPRRQRLLTKLARPPATGKLLSRLIAWIGFRYTDEQWSVSITDSLCAINHQLLFSDGLVPARRLEIPSMHHQQKRKPSITLEQRMALSKARNFRTGYQSNLVLVPNRCSRDSSPPCCRRVVVVVLGEAYQDMEEQCFVRDLPTRCCYCLCPPRRRVCFGIIIIAG